jgi:hypothetical protein
MTNADNINLFAAFCAALSAGFWAASALVNVRTGYDMDIELAEDLKRAAKLNGVGAAFASIAALSTVLISASKAVPFLAWVNR